MADERKYGSSKKFVGVKWREGPKGKVFYIFYRHPKTKRLIKEKVGAERDGFSAAYAMQIRSARIRDLSHDGLLPKETKTFTWGKLATRYIEWSAENKKSARDDRQRWESHLKGRIEGLCIEDVTSTTVEKIRDELKKRLAPATVKQILALLRAMHNKARGWKMTNAPNPVSSISMPRTDNTRERALTPEESALLLDALLVRSELAHGLALLSLNTGARLGELYKLTWADVDLSGRVLTFRWTKSGKTRRVPLNETALAWFKGREETKGLVFPSRVEKRKDTHSPSTFRHVADALFNEEVRDRRHRVVFHTLRHTFATRLVAGGVPLNVVRDLLGHSSMAMLERYAHLIPGARQAAVALLD